MRLPRVRVTVRRMMVVSATLAVSWSMCLGIGHLTIYRANVEGERAYMESARACETRHEMLEAVDWRRMAEDLARRNAESRSYIVTALSLTVLAILAGGLSLAVKTVYHSRNLVRRSLVDTCVGACLTLSKICLVGLALGCFGYLAVGLMVALTSE
jgi:hypothetical protein